MQPKLGVDFGDKEEKSAPCQNHDKETEIQEAKTRLKAFRSGALREDKSGKSRPGLISPYFTERLGFVLANGAKEHGDRNWEKGLPDEETLDSLERHIMAYKMSRSKGYTLTSNTEGDDHLAQAGFNLMVLIHNQEITKINEVNKESSANS